MERAPWRDLGGAFFIVAIVGGLRVEARGLAR
jgi:hypothetical protein